MKLYFHKWRDIDTGRLFKTGEERIAQTIEEAISDYHQENSAYEYVNTLVLDTQTKTFIEIDIEAEIQSRKVGEMSLEQLSTYWGLPIKQVERRLERIEDGLYN